MELGNEAKYTRSWHTGATVSSTPWHMTTVSHCLFVGYWV